MNLKTKVMINKTEHNPILKTIPEEKREDFKKACQNSEKYFYQNYIKKLPGNENLPEYSPEAFENYKKEAEAQRNFYRDKVRRRGGFKPSYLQRLEVYYKQLPDFIKNNNGNNNH